MSDLIERLRKHAKDQCDAEFPSDLNIFPEDLREAADRIEKLEAENERRYEDYRIQNDEIVRCHDTIEELEAENERLREAAQALVDRIEPRSKHGIADEFWVLVSALAAREDSDDLL